MCGLNNVIVGRAAQSNLKDFAHRLDNIKGWVEEINNSSEKMVYYFADVADNDYWYECLKSEIEKHKDLPSTKQSIIMFNPSSKNYCTAPIHSFSEFAFDKFSDWVKEETMRHMIRCSGSDLEDMELEVRGYIRDINNVPLMVIQVGLLYDLKQLSRDAKV